MAMREFITKNQIKHEFPIMENDFGMVINESLHRELDKLPTITEQEIVKPYLDKIRAEIEHLHNHPKLDFIKNDEIVDMVLEIIDKYISVNTRDCKTCKYQKDGHCGLTEVCHLCMWENQYTSEKERE